MNALRWSTVLVLLWTGIQKAWYGTWFQGEYLATAMRSRPGFELVFSPLMSDGERVTFLAGAVPRAGDGPFRFTSAGMVFVSNAAWILEIGLSFLLLGDRWRRIGVAGALILMVLIDLGTREVLFGTLFAGLVLSIAPGDLVTRLLPLFVGVDLVLAATRLGLLPAWSFN